LCPSRRSRLKLLPAALLILLPALAAAAEARLEVGGSVVGSSDDELEVRVELTNRGDQAALAVGVEAELFGHREKQQLDAGVPPGATRSAVLTFPLEDASPGVHALLLSLEYSVSPDPGAALLVFGQPAYILVALGENAAPAVRLTIPEATLDSVGRFSVGLASADGAPHPVRLRVHVPRGLRVDPVDSTLDVPATGVVSAQIKLFRVDAPWESRQGVVIVATATDGPLARTTAGTGVVKVLADPARMPRMRKPLLGLALVLLAGAALAEVLRRYR
jgi:hypothetical protein